MRFIHFAFLCLGTLLSPSVLAKELDIYLLIGQSNMAGRASIPSEYSKKIPKCFILNDKEEWSEAINPLNAYSTIRKDLKMQGVNLGYGFAKYLIKKDRDQEIGLVVNAKGGSKIKHWEKGSPFYDQALERTKKAMESGTLKAILWHQGESDSKNEEYLEKLETLINDLRKDFKSPKLPFIVGHVYYDKKDKPEALLINEQLSKLPTEVKYTACVTIKGLNARDNTHFDADSTVELGERYAKALIELTE